MSARGCDDEGNFCYFEGNISTGRNVLKLQPANLLRVVKRALCNIIYRR
jgi:hypothetical protein